MDHPREVLGVQRTHPLPHLERRRRRLAVARIDPGDAVGQGDVVAAHRDGHVAQQFGEPQRRGARVDRGVGGAGLGDGPQRDHRGGRARQQHRDPVVGSDAGGNELARERS